MHAIGDIAVQHNDASFSASGRMVFLGMTYFAVVYSYSAPEPELAKVRQAHREFLSASPALQLSGPFVGGEPGALLIFAAENQSSLEQFLDQDPFHLHGFIGSRTIREWNPVLGTRISAL